MLKRHLPFMSEKSLMQALQTELELQAEQLLGQ